MLQPELRDIAVGRWPSIFASYGVDQKLLSGRHQPCPFCGGKDRFRYTNYMDHGGVICNQCMPDGKDGIDFLMQMTGLSFKDLAGELRQTYGATVVDENTRKDTKTERIKRTLTAIWTESKPVQLDDPVHRYLTSRGLILPEGAQIKTHTSLPYYESTGDTIEIKGRYPAMIAAVQNAEGLPSTLHCTYLTEEGSKADVQVVRKIKPASRNWKGGAVRLSKAPSGVLVVAEGIETTLSYMNRYKMPGWAALNAGNLESFAPPKNTEIIIAADNDKNYTGQSAAYSLAKRLSSEGVSVQVDVAPLAGMDWADAP